jgi:DNA polymerase-1
VLKIVHNGKYDLGILAKHELALEPVDDTMLISYALDGASHGHGMDELAQRCLDYQTIPFESVCGKGKGQITFDQAPIDKATDYAAEDAEVTLRLWEALKPRLLKERMLGVYETLERPLVPVIAEMEGHGIRVDAARLRELSADFGQRMAALEEQAYQLAGRRFAIGSPKQLGEVLFDQMAMKSSGPSSGGAGRKTKTGAYATDAACWRSWRARATSCRAWCWAGASSRSSPAPTPSRCWSSSTRPRAGSTPTTC